MSSSNNRKLVILTGAGFSKSFGLPSTIDLKNTLHNKLSNNPDLLEKLKCENANFEDICSELENKSDHSNFEEFKKAVIDIFRSMIDRYNNIEDDIKRNTRNHFILKFFENIDENDSLDVFTLNMDVLFEHPQLFHYRGAGSNDGIDLYYPGLFNICNSKPEEYNNYSDRKIDRMCHNAIIEEAIIDYRKKYSDEYSETKTLDTLIMKARKGYLKSKSSFIGSCMVQ
ncbi:MAG: hypothetical protein K2X50_10140 [Gammaproteobacteria bacterium]|nr:hypothetical protein [Gammaproteobacteria bacterium]